MPCAFAVSMRAESLWLGTPVSELEAMFELSASGRWNTFTSTPASRAYKRATSRLLMCPCPPIVRLRKGRASSSSAEISPCTARTVGAAGSSGRWVATSNILER